MGFAKHQMMMEEGLEQLAAALLVETGACETCEIHDELTSNGDSEAVVEACDLADARISAGEIDLPSGFSGTDFTEIIRRVADEAPCDCYCCAKNSESD